MGPRRVDTLRDALDSLVDPRRWPDGIKDYLTGYALEVLKRWGDGTRLIPDPWALMELAFNPLFKDLSKLPFIDRQLADEAEDLLLNGSSRRAPLQLREGDAERPAHEPQPGALRGHGFRRPERGPARVHVGGGLRRVQEAPSRSHGGRGRGHVDAPHVLQLRVTAHHGFGFGVPPLRVTCYILIKKNFDT